jgi:hypothetical protein
MNPSNTSSRTIKVELAGDPFYKNTFPKIRLQGKWLAGLSFKPTGRVAVRVTAPGKLALEFIEPD